MLSVCDILNLPLADTILSSRPRNSNLLTQGKKKKKKAKAYEKDTGAAHVIEERAEQESLSVSLRIKFH